MMNFVNCYLFSPFDFTGLIKNLTVRNALYFILMVPITFYYDIGISVVELSDLCVAGIIVVWIFRKKVRVREKLIVRKFSQPIKAFLLFNCWAMLTICFASYMIAPVSIILMIAKSVKVILYVFVVVVFIHEMVSNSHGYRYLFLGLLLSLILHLPNQINSTRNADTRQLKVMAQRESLATKEENGAKNSNASLAACYLVFLISILKRKYTYLGFLIVGVLLLMLLYSASRGSWITFVVGLVLLGFVWIKNKPSQKDDVLLAGRKQHKWVTYIIIVLLGGIIAFSANSRYIHKNLFESVYLDPVTGEETYTGGRFNLAREAVLNQIKLVDYFFGRGYYSRFYRDDMWRFGAHNQYIQFVWETGVLGLVLFLNIFYRFFIIKRYIAIKRDRLVFVILLSIVLFTGNSEIFFYGPTYILGQFILITYALMYYSPKLYSSFYQKKLIF